MIALNLGSPKKDGWSVCSLFVCINKVIKICLSKMNIPPWFIALGEGRFYSFHAQLISESLHIFENELPVLNAKSIQ